MENKRIVSLLIPYKLKSNEVFIYLQKKADDAPRSPGQFGFFGGGKIGNENSEQALEREIKEELDFVLKRYSFFGNYDHHSIKNVFILKVNDDFENKIKVKEGKYGKWFKKDEALAEPKLGDEDKIVVADFYSGVK